MMAAMGVHRIIGRSGLRALVVTLGMVLGALAPWTVPQRVGASGNRLDAPGYLFAGDSLQSSNGRFLFVMQGDGNLVLYDYSTPVWASSWMGLANIPNTFLAL